MSTHCGKCFGQGHKEENCDSKPVKAATLPDGGINKVMELVLASAHQARENAGMGGYHSDGGASDLETQVKFYRLGQANLLPEEWKRYADKTDPEYLTYLRLRLKFKDKL
jgi:hypothetical protein